MSFHYNKDNGTTNSVIIISVVVLVPYHDILHKNADVIFLLRLTLITPPIAEYVPYKLGDFMSTPPEEPMK